MLLLQGTRLLSLIGEPRSCMLCDIAKKIKVGFARSHLHPLSAYFSPTQSWINLQFDHFLLKGNFSFFPPSIHFIKYTAKSWLLNTFWCTGLGSRVSKGCLWRWEVQNVAKQREDFAGGPVTETLCSQRRAPRFIPRSWTRSDVAQLKFLHAATNKTLHNLNK